MSLELWVPRPDAKPDINNLFDMMLVFQEEIDKKSDKESKLLEAHYAARALRSCLSNVFESIDNLTVVTRMALVDSVEEASAGLLVENVGLHSQLETVQFTSMPPHMPGVLTLGLDVEAMYKTDSPDETDLVLRGATVPITQVEYIETV